MPSQVTSREDDAKTNTRLIKLTRPPKVQNHHSPMKSESKARYSVAMIYTSSLDWVGEQSRLYIFISYDFLKGDYENKNMINVSGELHSIFIYT